MANDSNVQYDSEESSDADENYDNDSVRSSTVFNWHKDRRRSVESAFPGIVEDSDDENRPSMSTRMKYDLEDDEDDENQPRSRRCSSLRDENGRIRSRWWCYLFSVCSIISIVGIAMISWAMIRVRKNNRSNNDNMSAPKPHQDAGTKLSLSWEKDVECAPITIDITTDQYGNETTWVLYKVKEVNEDKNAFQATRKQLRPVAFSDGNRRTEEITNNGSQVIRSGGPYTYFNDKGTNYTSPVCLPEGNYNFVAYLQF